MVASLCPFGFAVWKIHCTLLQPRLLKPGDILAVARNFQSVLYTLENLFAFFLLFYVRHKNNLRFRNYLHVVNSSCSDCDGNQNMLSGNEVKPS